MEQIAKVDSEIFTLGSFLEQPDVTLKFALLLMLLEGKLVKVFFVFKNKI